MKTLSTCFATAALALASTACGSLSSGDEPATLATLEGRLVNTQAIAAPSSLRVAVIWLSASERTGFTVAQDVEVEPVFPSNFKLALRDVPPESAMVDSDTEQPRNGDDESAPGYNPDDPDSQGQGGTSPNPDPNAPGPKPASIGLQDTDIDIEPPAGVRVAVGTLVAYEDTNGNGKLDLVDIDANQFVDRVIGANPELMLFYVEGDPAAWGATDSAGNGPQRGYQLLHLKSCPEQDTLCRGNPTEGCDAYEIGQEVESCNPTLSILPVSSLFELPISNDPELSSMMCRSQSGVVSEQGLNNPNEPPQLDPGPAGYPAASEVSCDEGGRAYYHNACTFTDHGPCRGVSSACVQRHVGLPEGTVPANWPCTIQP